jgi:AcrR family transcriptional regulator
VPRVAPEYLETKRRAILDAAMICFGRDGFHHTTIHDIVREAGLSAGAIYRYFGSKEDIIASIAEEHRTPDPTVFERIASQVDVAAAFEALIRGSFARMNDADEQRWRRVTVQLWGEALRNERVMEIVRAGRDDPVDRIAEMIRAGQRQGEVPKDIDPTAGARVCASLFYGLVLQAATDPTVDVDGYVEVVLTMLAAVLRRTGQARGRRA